MLERRESRAKMKSWGFEKDERERWEKKKKKRKFGGINQQWGESREQYMEILKPLDGNKLTSVMRNLKEE
jgi:hypothetical protein